MIKADVHFAMPFLRSLVAVIFWMDFSSQLSVNHLILRIAPLLISSQMTPLPNNPGFIGVTLQYVSPRLNQSLGRTISSFPCRCMQFHIPNRKMIVAGFDSRSCLPDGSGCVFFLGERSHWFTPWSVRFCWRLPEWQQQPQQQTKQIQIKVNTAKTQ